MSAHPPVVSDKIEADGYLEKFRVDSRKTLIYDKNGKVLNTPEKGNDHTMDAIRYALSLYRPTRRIKADETQTKKIDRPLTSELLDKEFEYGNFRQIKKSICDANTGANKKNYARNWRLRNFDL